MRTNRLLLFSVVVLAVAVVQPFDSYAVVNWTKYSGNPVLTEGAAGQWDQGGVEFPAIIKDGTTFKMWYTAQFLGVGQVGYATSSDGIVWTKYGSNPVFGPSSAPGAWDSVYVGACWVLKEGSVYKMWYTGAIDPGSASQIGYATSTDGISWVRNTPNTPVVLKGGPNDWDGGTGRPNDWDVGDGVSAPFVIYDTSSSQYKMWYVGRNNTKRLEGIGYAVSSDGINWTKYNDSSTGSDPYLNSDPVLRIRDPGTWEEEEGTSASVIKEENLYHMWYDAGDDTAYAYSLDGIHWTKYGGNPILRADDPRVIRDGGLYKMWYSYEPEPDVGEDAIEVLGYATSQAAQSDMRPVGDSPGQTTYDVGKDETVRLDLNITNSRGDAFADIKAEWLVFTGTVGGVQLPIFVLTSGGQIFDIRNVSDFNATTYSYNHGADVRTLATLAIGSLGFKAGDRFLYGYAYTTSDVSKFLFDNIVTLNIR